MRAHTKRCWRRRGELCCISAGDKCLTALCVGFGGCVGPLLCNTGCVLRYGAGGGCGGTAAAARGLLVDPAVRCMPPLALAPYSARAALLSRSCRATACAPCTAVGAAQLWLRKTTVFCESGGGGRGKRIVRKTGRDWCESLCVTTTAFRCVPMRPPRDAQARSHCTSWLHPGRVRRPMTSQRQTLQFGTWSHWSD